MAAVLVQEELVVGNALLFAVLSPFLFADKETFLYFTQKGCAPCEKMESVTFKDRKVKEALRPMLFVKVDIHKHPDVARQYRVRATPTYIILKDDKETKRGVGYKPPSDFLKWLKGKKSDGGRKVYVRRWRRLRR